MNIQKVLKGRDGVTAIEYGLIAALIAVAIIAAMSLVGTEVQNTFDIWTNAVRNAVQGAQGNGGSGPPGAFQLHPARFFDLRRLPLRHLPL